MKLGAEPKKIVILAVLIVTAAIVFLINSMGGETSSPAPATTAPAAPGGRGPAAGSPASEPATRPRTAARTTTEFRPQVEPKRGEERPDPTTIDPTLRLDLLAKLQEVQVQGTHRSIFDFGQPPAPTPDPKEVAAAKTPVPSPLVKPEETKPDEKPAEPAKPTAPPIPLKFYGYISPTDKPAKRAFFIEGEEIHVVSEGEVVKKRYKVVRIGINSVVVEDTQFGQQQTLQLEEQPG
jgi:hypothetical protein